MAPVCTGGADEGAEERKAPPPNRWESRQKTKMSLSRLSIWISHLLALTAFATLTLSQALPLPLFFAGALFTFGSLWARFRGWSAPFSPRFCNVVTIFFFLFFVIDTFWISQSLIGGGVHLLIYLTIL